MKKFKIEHFFKDESYTIKADSEDEAWDKFLDRKLPSTEMAEDYTIYEVF